MSAKRRKEADVAQQHKHKKNGVPLYAVLIIGACVVVSCIYMASAWQRNYLQKAEETIAVSKTIAAMLHPEHIGRIRGDAVDYTTANYLLIKQSMQRLVKETPPISQTFIAALREGVPTMLVHSVAQSAPQNSLPALDSKHLANAYQHKQTSILVETETVREKWVATLTPIIRPDSGKTVAVLYVLYDRQPWLADVWKRIMPDGLVVLSLLTMLCALLYITREHLMLKLRSAELAVDEALFHSVFDQAPIGISIGLDNRITYAAPDGRYSVNSAFEQILGRSKAELENTSWADITYPADIQKDIELANRFQAGEIDRYTIEKRFVRPDQTAVWTKLTIGALKDQARSDSIHVCVLEDINEQKKMEDALRESERSKSVLVSHLPGLAYRCKFDRDWTMEFVSEGCKGLTGYDPDMLLNNRDLTFNDIIASEYRDILWNEWEQAREQNRDFRFEYEIITKQKERKWVLELGQIVEDDQHAVVALEGIIIDISNEKMREAQVEYMSNHDFLTGLYNRSYFEAEKTHLSKPEQRPLGIAVCDINGVRVINDAFGPSEGDKLIADVAYLIQSFCRSRDILCRTGGDEFSLLMPNTDEVELASIMEQILHAIERYNQSERQHPYEVSVSIGTYVLHEGQQTVEQAITNATEHLNHRKLLDRKSFHNAMLSSIMATLYARSHETEEHGKRLTRFTRMIGEKLRLSATLMDDLMLLSMLHDIGKIGIDDRILNKPGSLTPEEWVHMKMHTEIGARIAKSTPELEHIADCILYHHERWDGGGYPSGLAKEEIPLPSRILAVADAYDAMTEDRVYRKAMPKEEALAEIERNAGKQFDPSIAALFISLMQKNSD